MGKGSGFNAVPCSPVHIYHAFCCCSAVLGTAENQFLISLYLVPCLLSIKVGFTYALLLYCSYGALQSGRTVKVQSIRSSCL